MRKVILGSVLSLFIVACGGSSSSSSSDVSSGQGGSMARFAISVTTFILLTKER